MSTRLKDVEPDVYLEAKHYVQWAILALEEITDDTNPEWDKLYDLIIELCQVVNVINDVDSEFSHNRWDDYRASRATFD